MRTVISLLILTATEKQTSLRLIAKQAFLFIKPLPVQSSGKMLRNIASKYRWVTFLKMSLVRRLSSAAEHTVTASLVSLIYQVNYIGLIIKETSFRNGRETRSM